MVIRDTRREAAIERMADRLLEVGLAGASLRTLAAAAGTSDRMLLYYFEDKDELLAATFARLAGRITGLLDAALPAGERLEEGPLLRALWAAMSASSLKPYVDIWLELAAGAARGQEPHRTVGGAIADGFLAWVSGHLESADADRGPTSARLLATLEGMVLLAALGRGEISQMAASAPPEGG